MKSIILFLFVIICICFTCFSCNSNQKDPVSEFPRTEELQFTCLEMSNYLFKPRIVEAFDSLLLIFDPTETRCFFIWNLNTNKIVLEGGSIGNGPDELISCNIDKIDSDKFQVLDATLRKTLIYSMPDILDKSKFVPIKRIDYGQLIKDTKNNVQVLYYLNDSLYLGLGIFEKGKYVKYTNHNSEYILKYPESSNNSINPGEIHQGVLHVNQKKNLILYHSPFGYYYELLSFKDNLVTPIFEEYVPHLFREESGTVLITLDTKCGIGAADFTENEIFMMYSGRTEKEYPKNSYFSDKILVFDYNGNKEVKYLLNRDIYMMNVDEKTKRIYAVSKNPETYEFEIGYFGYE